MATAKKAAAPAVKKAAPAKKAAATVTTITVKAPETAKRGRVAQKFAYTGKQLSETKVKTPQFQALVISMQDIESKEFDRKSFTMQEVVDLGVEEGHISMPNTKTQKNRKSALSRVTKKP